MALNPANFYKCPTRYRFQLRIGSKAAFLFIGSKGLFLLHSNFNLKNCGEVILNQYGTFEISLRVPHIRLTDLKS